MKSTHLMLCGALIVAGALLLSTGAGAYAVLPLLLCGAMMGGMMWMMMRSGGPRDGNR